MQSRKNQDGLCEGRKHTIDIYVRKRKISKEKLQHYCRTIFYNFKNREMEK